MLTVLEATHTLLLAREVQHSLLHLHECNWMLHCVCVFPSSPQTDKHTHINTRESIKSSKHFALWFFGKAGAGKHPGSLCQTPTIGSGPNDCCRSQVGCRVCCTRVGGEKKLHDALKRRTKVGENCCRYFDTFPCTEALVITIIPHGGKAMDDNGDNDDGVDGDGHEFTSAFRSQSNTLSAGGSVQFALQRLKQRKNRSHSFSAADADRRCAHQVWSSEVNTFDRLQFDCTLESGEWQKGKKRILS